MTFKKMINQNDFLSESSSDYDPETSEDEVDDVPTQSHVRETRSAMLPW